MIIEILIGVGIVALFIGVFIGTKLKKQVDIDTDTCLSYLKEKGYKIELTNYKGK